MRGRDVAGRVEAVGTAVTRFRPGDEVYAEIDSGSFAECASVPEGVLALKPSNLTFTSGQQYDLILDLIGNHSLTKCWHALTPTAVTV